MKIVNAWRAVAVCTTLGAVAACPVQARADSAPAVDSGTDEKKGGDIIIVQPPIIKKDTKK